MNAYTALLLILATATATATATDVSSRGLTDIPYNEDKHAGVTEEEYEELINWRQTVINYWTPEAIRSATPLHKVLLTTNDDSDVDANDGASSSSSLSSVTAEIDGLKFSTDNDGPLRHLRRQTNHELHNRQRQRILQLVENDPWTSSGDVHQASGRLLFERAGRNYQCSATAVNDGSIDNIRSIILTAGHCVYDDENKQFATNFLFIPQQDDEGSDESDRDCDNDKYGCWTPQFAVVDNGWASRSWPDNIPSDYAYLVVSDVGSHSGGTDLSVNDEDALDKAVPALDISFTAPITGIQATALGYSGSEDPNFMYCTRNLSRETRISRDGYKLNGCELSAGASGGP